MKIQLDARSFLDAWGRVHRGEVPGMDRREIDPVGALRKQSSKGSCRPIGGPYEKEPVHRPGPIIPEVAAWEFVLSTSGFGIARPALYHLYGYKGPSRFVIPAGINESRKRALRRLRWSRWMDHDDDAMPQVVVDWFADRLDVRIAIVQPDFDDFLYLPGDDGGPVTPLEKAQFAELQNIERMEREGKYARAERSRERLFEIQKEIRAIADGARTLAPT